MKTDLLDIRNCDCIELLKKSKDNEYDLAICDVPYGININHNMGRRRNQPPSKHKKVMWDNSAPNKHYFEELIRVSKNQILWGANHFISKIPYDSSCWLLWDKGFSEKVSFAQFELAWTSFNGTCKKYDRPPNQSYKIHPTQKPVALYTWLLRNYAKEGDKILDTHMGSGSIAIACHYMGFNLTACELDPDYYKAACKRIDRETRQISLF